jgi:hypothetical protein
MVFGLTFLGKNSQEKMMKSDDIFSGKLLSTQMAVLSSFSMQRHNDATH